MNLEALEDKGTISVSDIVGVMQNMQVDIMKKCATNTEILSLRSEIRQIEDESNKVMEFHVKNNDLNKTVENMNILAAKIKD